MFPQKSCFSAVIQVLEKKMWWDSDFNHIPTYLHLTYIAALLKLSSYTDISQ